MKKIDVLIIGAGAAQPFTDGPDMGLDNIAAERSVEGAHCKRRRGHDGIFGVHAGVSLGPKIA